MTTKQATDLVNGWMQADSGRNDALAFTYLQDQMDEEDGYEHEDGDEALFLKDFVQDNIKADHADYLADLLDEAVDSADYTTIAAELMAANAE
jgi:hypothetical protein